MDRNATDRLAVLPPSPLLSRPREDRSVRREEIEEALNLWEKALSKAAPSGAMEASAASEVFLLTEPLQAPRESGSEIAPAETTYEDGFLARPASDLEAELVQRTFERTRRRLGVETEDLPETKPIVRIFIFDLPVEEVRDAVGTLYTIGEDGELRKLEPGMRAKRIVEVIEPHQARAGTRETRRLTCTIRGGIAHWS